MVKRSREKPERLTPRQKRFIECYARHFDPRRAAEEAGYKPGACGQMASYLLRRPLVMREIQRIVAMRIDRTEITQEYVLARLRENAERALQRRPVLDSAGNCLGTWVYDGTVANRALELLGKHLGMFGLLVKHDHNHLHDHNHHVVKISDLKLSADEKRAIGLQCLELLRARQGAPAPVLENQLTPPHENQSPPARDPGPERSS